MNVYDDWIYFINPVWKKWMKMKNNNYDEWLTYELIVNSQWKNGLNEYVDCIMKN